MRPRPSPAHSRAHREKIAAPSTAARAAAAKALGAGALDPMLASVGTDIPAGSDWTFEPKYDGIRVLAYATANAARLVTRNGKDKTAQFPARRRGGAQARVARPARRRARWRDRRPRSRQARALPGAAAAHAREGRAMPSPATRRARPSPSWPSTSSSMATTCSCTSRGPNAARSSRSDSRSTRPPSCGSPNPSSTMDARCSISARASGWEGIIAKRVDAPYQPGARSRDWLKLKLEFRQEFVVGGFTEPRNTRQHIGALLLGYYDHGRLIYAGNMGGGFDNAGLAEMYEMLAPHERKSSPFEETPRPREPVHWVTPRVVVEVKFNEWTSDGKLRQPIYVGTRDDKDPRTVKREHASVQESTGAAKKKSAPAKKVVRAKTRTSVAATAKKGVAAKKSAAPSKKSPTANKSSARGASSAKIGIRRAAARRHRAGWRRRRRRDQARRVAARLEPRQGLLSGRGLHEGRLDALLRARRAADSADDRGSTARAQAHAGRDQGRSLLSAEAAAARARSGARGDGRERRGRARGAHRRRRSRDAALHRADRMRLRRSVGVAHRLPGRDGLSRFSISTQGRERPSSAWSRWRAG